MKKSKTTFLRHLNENTNSPNFIGCKENLKMSINLAQFLFRGSDAFADFGEKEERGSRVSLTESNIFLNVSSLFFKDFPSRKKSYFSTNSKSTASDFGDDVFILMPHDSVKNFAVMKGDFNLIKLKSLRNLSNKLDSVTLSDFGYSFPSSIDVFYSLFIEQFAHLDNSKSALNLIIDLNDVTQKIAFAESADESDFEKLDKVFVDVFENEQVQQFIAYYLESQKNSPFSSTKDISDLHEFYKVIKEGKVESITGIFKMLVEEIFSNTKLFKSFREVVEFFLNIDDDDDYEVWFQGKCSYFKLEWLKDVLITNQENENGNKIYGSLSNEQIAKAFSLILNRQ